MSPSHPSSLQGLIELSRRDGVEIRPKLLRVLVDLYIQQPMHTESEAARFTELVCRLVERADPPTRIAMSSRPSRCCASARYWAPRSCTPSWI